MPLALGSLACLLASKELMGDPENMAACVLESAGLNEIMRLDAAAVAALNLLPPSKKAAGAGLKFSSLLSVLSNGCWSKCGTRVLKRWILQPLLDAAKLSRRQDMVELFINDPVLRSELKSVVVCCLLFSSIRVVFLSPLSPVQVVCFRVPACPRHGRVSGAASATFSLLTGPYPALQPCANVAKARGQA
jgi:hypothetical protein